ncbi:hypothetical protein A3K70_01685 [Candidatus Bathyarchaeota archaeon RBG_16_48_13]|nr:MAG: hypothetical protein A3K70_01685 [Candidatus Bathyarchaeota archaeon RBG_16_48_13]
MLPLPLSLSEATGERLQTLPRIIISQVPFPWRMSGGVREAPLGGFPQGPVANEPIETPVSFFT